MTLSKMPRLLASSSRKATSSGELLPPAAPITAAPRRCICDVTPDVMNVIPGEVDLGIDIRSISAAAKKKVADELKAYIKKLTDERDIPYNIKSVSDEKPAVMNENIVKLVSDTAAKLGFTHIEMPSGAGHDSMHWADYAPTGMIFIPCRNGISHNPAEYASPEDNRRGARVFSEVIRTLANKNFSL